MQFPPHFSLAELTRTSVDRPNIPPDETVSRLLVLAWQMEGVRALLGGKPIRVTSGYRSAEVNKAVGGSSTSDHMTGWACDFAPPGVTPHEAGRVILASGLPFDQLILYPKRGHVHISCAPSMRRQVLEDPT